jgi:hypothetical protein
MCSGLDGLGHAGDAARSAVCATGEPDECGKPHPRWSAGIRREPPAPAYNQETMSAHADGTLERACVRWKVDRENASFELKIRRRTGPITFIGALEDVDATIELDADGRLGIDAVVDLSSFELDPDRFPRLGAQVLPALAGNGPVRFTAAGVAGDVAGLAPGPIDVIGIVGADTGPDYMALRAQVTLSRDLRGLTAILIVDHRRFGLGWIAGPLDAPTELVLRAPLVPVAVDEPAPAGVVRRRTRISAVHRRYRRVAAAHAA